MKTLEAASGQAAMFGTKQQQSDDDKTCQSFGVKVGTPEYAKYAKCHDQVPRQSGERRAEK